MRFTAKFKKKTCKQLTDDRKVCVDLKKDHYLKNLQKKCPFKDCKYAKYLPKDTEDKCDLVALYNPTTDRKRGRLKRLQIIAIFIVKSANGSTSISDLVNLNKRVNRETEKCKTDTSDTEAMQMLCICREFQIVIKKTLKDPALQKKNREPISKEYDDNQNSLRILEKEVKTHTQNKCSSNRECKTHQRNESDSMKFCHGNFMDLASHKEAGDFGSGKVQDHATYTKNAFEHQRVIFNDQTIRLKERHMQVNDQTKRGNCVYISEQDETDELKGAAAKFNNFPGRNYEKVHELARIKLYDQFKKANVYDKEEVRKEVKLCQNSKKIVFDQTN
ncbi:uncharacterized protein LOC132735825 [Ruditapes philippinarum]|uniref:uncharacterized protein LOC132735825 n=1 Tax=Ruditapes philippinarum TaxID=129788 RepID=UPI00295BD94F|nr:uncharacterized protein LOC132735825 [Ruditapes philippinarum]